MISIDQIRMRARRFNERIDACEHKVLWEKKGFLKAFGAPTELRSIIDAKLWNKIRNNRLICTNMPTGNSQPAGEPDVAG